MKILLNNETKRIYLNSSAIVKTAFSETTLSGWEKIQNLSFPSSGTVDLNDAKYAIFDQGKLIAPVDTSGVFSLTVADSASLTISNATFDIGIWPGDDVASSWTQITGIASNEIYSASNFPTDVQPVPINAIIYNEDGETEFLRYDFNIDGQAAPGNIKDKISDAVDANWKILHDINGNGPIESIVAFESRGNLLRQVAGQSYDPADTNTFESYASADAPAEEIVGFDATLDTMMSSLLAMKTVIDDSSLGTDYSDLVLGIWNDANQEYFVRIHSITESGDSSYVRVLFDPDTLIPEVSDRSTDSQFLFTFFNHPAFIENPSNPSGRKVFALKGCFDGTTKGTAYFRHIGTGGVSSDLRLQCHARHFFVTGGNGSSITFSGCTFLGASADSILFDTATLSTTVGTVTDCSFLHNETCVRTDTTWTGYAVVEDCTFDRTNGRHVELNSFEDSYDDSNPPASSAAAEAASPGNEVRRCTFLQNNSQSPMTIANMGNNVIEENVFRDLRNSHGNALSMYRGSPAGSVIRNNLFYNCARSLNLKADDGEEGTVIGACLTGPRVYNNVFYIDDDFGYPVPNAPGFRVLEYAYSRRSSDPGYNSDARLIVTRNTLLVNHDNLLATNEADAYGFGFLLDSGDAEYKRTYSANLFSDGGIAFTTAIEWSNASADGTTCDEIFSFNNAGKYGESFPASSYAVGTSDDYPRWHAYWTEGDDIEGTDISPASMPGIGAAWTIGGNALTEAQLQAIQTATNLATVDFNTPTLAADDTDSSFRPATSKVQLVTGTDEVDDQRSAAAQTAYGKLETSSNKWNTTPIDFRFYGAFDGNPLSFRYTYNLGPQIAFANTAAATAYMATSPGNMTVVFTDSGGTTHTYTCTTPTQTNQYVRWSGGDADNFANIAPKGSDGLQAGDSFTASIA